MAGLHGSGKTTTSESCELAKNEDTRPLLVSVTSTPRPRREHLKVVRKRDHSESRRFRSARRTRRRDGWRKKHEGSDHARAAWADSCDRRAVAHRGKGSSWTRMQSLARPTRRDPFRRRRHYRHDAVNSADEFHKSFTLTASSQQTDGDARGGAAPFDSSVTGQSIKFTASVKMTTLWSTPPPPFHPAESLANSGHGATSVADRKSRVAGRQAKSQDLAAKSLSSRWLLHSRLPRSASASEEYGLAEKPHRDLLRLGAFSGMQGGRNVDEKQEPCRRRSSFDALLRTRPSRVINGTPPQAHCRLGRACRKSTTAPPVRTDEKMFKHMGKPIFAPEMAGMKLRCDPAFGTCNSHLSSRLLH